MPVARPITQNTPWLMDETKGDFPADAAVTAELENTMMTPNTLSPSTAIRNPW